jgi:D-alanyl-D-alanine carboxypeptidase
VLAARVGGTAVADTADATGHIDREAVQRGIDKMAKTGALGVQVRITDGRRGATLHSGVAELGGNRPVPLDGRFRVGSITKVFVSTVVLQLVGEGKVDLDAPVERYLPGLLPDGGKITVRMLLQHTSGLYNYTEALPLDPAGFETIRYRHHDPAELVALATAKPLNFEPGTSWSYSNTNYIVAGLLVEKITGRPYEKAVDKRILQPIGLRDTIVPGDRASVPGPHAHGYYQVGAKAVDITELNPSVAWSAGEIISTTADLDRFVDALLDGRLLKPKQLDEMTKTLPFTQGYGLGLEQQVLPCGAVVWGHGGSIPGYESIMLSSRDTGKRLEASLTSAPVGGQVDGYREALDAVFCG